MGLPQRSSTAGVYFRLPVWLVIVWIVWCIVWSLPTVCRGQCDDTYAFACIMHVVDMTSDGGSKLRRIIDDDDDDDDDDDEGTKYYASITIERLVVSSGASGPFLSRIGAYTESIRYERYRDAVFQLPPGSTLSDIAIAGSGLLRSFIAGENGALRQLVVHDCLLDRVPATLGKMVNLQQLSLTSCLLTGLRMDALADNRELIGVDLSENKIRQLFPLSAGRRSAAGLAVEELRLSHNRIERLDMAAFAHLAYLERLDLRHNAILQLVASAPVTLPSLARLTMANNGITAVDLTNATLPALAILFLDDNALPEVPLHWGTLPNLHTLSLENNKIVRMDLSRLGPLANLAGLYCANNSIDSVRATTPFRLTRLDVLDLQANRLGTLNLTGCDFPSIGTIVLIDNQLSTVPALFQRYPTVRLILDGNPIRCGTLTPLKNRLVDGRLAMNNVWSAKDCGTTASIRVTNYSTVCCNA